MPAPFVQAVTAKGEVIDTKSLPRNEVLLNVYNVGQGTAVKRINMVNFVGGVFHGGIEVYNMEYCYGGHEDWSTGVGKCYPRAHPCHNYRETVRMGQTKLSEMAVEKVVKKLVSSGDWAGILYKFIGHNCLDFCSALGIELGIGRIPAFYDRYGRAAEKVLVNPFNAAKRALGRKKEENDIKPNYMGNMFSQSCCAVDLRDVVSDDDSEASWNGKQSPSNYFQMSYTDLGPRRMSGDAFFWGLADSLHDGTLNKQSSSVGKPSPQPQPDTHKNRTVGKSKKAGSHQDKGSAKHGTDAKAPQSRIQLLSVLFDAYDRDGDGRLNRLELLRFLECGGMEATPKEWRESYASMCTEAGAEPARGLDKKQIKQLANDLTKKQLEGMYAKHCERNEKTRPAGSSPKAKSKPMNKSPKQTLRESDQVGTQPTPTKTALPSKPSKGTKLNLDQNTTPAGMTLCKMGCGRLAAEGNQGRTFDTCCKGCASGSKHGLACEARFQKASIAASAADLSQANTAAKVSKGDKSGKNTKGSAGKNCDVVKLQAPAREKNTPAASHVSPPISFEREVRNMLFCCFDQDCDRVLSPKELRNFVESIGFEGSENEWTEWYEGACTQVSAEITMGLNEDQFLILTEDLEPSTLSKLLGNLQLPQENVTVQPDEVDRGRSDCRDNIIEALRKDAHFSGNADPECNPLDLGLRKIATCLPVSTCVTTASPQDGNVEAEHMHTKVIEDDRDLFRAAMSQICVSKAQEHTPPQIVHKDGEEDEEQQEEKTGKQEVMDEEAYGNIVIPSLFSEVGIVRL